MIIFYFGCFQDAPEEPVVSICGHVFCRQCISEQMGNGDDTTCRFPKCRKGLNSSLLFTLAALKNPALGGVSGSVEDGETGVVSGGAEVEPNWNTSSKIDAVINTLQALPKLSVLVEDGKILKGPKAEKLLKSEALEVKESEGLPMGSALTVASESSGSTVEKVDSTEKAIVFSQWTSMLDLLETPLKDAGFCYRRLDGTMSVVARDRAVSDFNTLPEVWPDVMVVVVMLYMRVLVIEGTGTGVGCGRIEWWNLNLGGTVNVAGDSDDHVSESREPGTEHGGR